MTAARLSVAILLAAFCAPAGAQERRPEASPEARAALADFAGCVARISSEKAHSALTTDFTTLDYRNALRALADKNSDCHRSRRTMRAGGLPFAAALAEALLHRGETPLNVRLVRAAPKDAPTYSVTDRMAMCVARSDPDNVARLLSANIASDGERQAADALQVAVERCTPVGAEADLGPYGLRSILATASYRLLAAAGEAK